MVDADDRPTRRRERQPVSIPVYLRTADKTLVRMQARDLTTHGVFLEGRAPNLHLGEVVTLHFCLRLEDVMRVRRKIARVKRFAGNGIGCTLEPGVD